MKYIIMCIILLGSFSFAQELPKFKRWDFNDLKGWSHLSQDDNPNQQCEIVKGTLKITTKAGSRDRKKMQTVDQLYTTGRYKWRTFISKLGKNDQASIGSWIYCDDQHEIDFEVGYGKESERAKYKAKEGEVLAYMTTQAHPFSSVAYPIKPGWHIFEIDLTLKDGKYLVKWLIDGKVRHTIQQTFGNEFKFLIYCSLENLGFVGDHLPKQDNWGAFDYVEYKFHK